MRGLVLETGYAGPSRRVRIWSLSCSLGDTTAQLTSWVARSSYAGRWREARPRSAIVIKLMAYAERWHRRRTYAYLPPAARPE